MPDALIPSTIAFAPDYSKESKHYQERYQCYHTFDSTGKDHSGLVTLNSIRPPMPEFPRFYKNTPLGQCTIMTPSEYSNIMKTIGEKNKVYERHIKNLEKKNPNDYIIKNSVPSHNKRCYVCRDNI